MTLVLFAACENEKAETTGEESSDKATGCTACHFFELDKNHDIGCTECHGGNNDTAIAEEAHAGFLAKPAHPATMSDVCGRCHKEMVKLISHSNHFTLKNEVNQVRKVFGATSELRSLVDIPVSSSPQNIVELSDDLLRRYCLRCHVYYEGDSFSQTLRGTGCAACHLQYDDGELVSHAFMAEPSDDNCLQCHYGNYVGADYYGRYEHDFKWEYRTPYQVNGNYPERPYGVELHQLAPDIHQQKGMACLDCHPGNQLKNALAPKTTCASCHMTRRDKEPPLTSLVAENDQLYLTSKKSGRKHKVPALQHQAHHRYLNQVACEVCHAQWSYNDTGTHLMRHDIDHYDLWWSLTVQGSSEVEQLLDLSETYDILPTMSDKITGTRRTGIWYKGFELRRWENLLIGKDLDGVIKIFRPVLDLHLSYVNEEDEVVFDNITPHDPLRGMRPYTPHTTGKAGLFYKKRLQQALPLINKKSN